jgi:Lrp/AsnC family transcriptional regulator, leucine-responsive regulatory protein
VHPGKAGQHMTFIVGIEIEQKRPDLYENLRHWLASADGVQQAYNVTGASDFMIIATAPTLDDFDSLMNRMMAENPNIRKYITSVVLQTYKRTLFVPTIMNDRLV